MPKTLQQAAADSLAVQDACNLSGVAHSFLAAVQAVNEEARRLNEDGDWRNNHPIIRLFVDKLAHLSGLQYEALGKLSLAYDECRRLAEETT